MKTVKCSGSYHIFNTFASVMMGWRRGGGGGGEGFWF